MNHARQRAVVPGMATHSASPLAAARTRTIASTKRLPRTFRDEEPTIVPGRSAIQRAPRRRSRRFEVVLPRITEFADL
jgi:hypothetical protein